MSGQRGYLSLCIILAFEKGFNLKIKSSHGLNKERKRKENKQSNKQTTKTNSKAKENNKVREKSTLSISEPTLRTRETNLAFWGIYMGYKYGPKKTS